MHRVQTLRLPHSCNMSANIITYSFACGPRSTSHMRVFTQGKKTYLTRCVGDVPENPIMMVANIWGVGSWVAFLKQTKTNEHAVFRGWSKAQVVHAWNKCNGEVLISVTYTRLLRQIIDHHFAPEKVGCVTWRSTGDVMRMIDANNIRQSPCTLYGKRPFKCTCIVNPCDESLNGYLLNMRNIYNTLNQYRRITNGY